MRCGGEPQVDWHDHRPARHALSGGRMNHLLSGIVGIALLFGSQSASAAATTSSSLFTVGASVDGQGAITQIQNGPEMPASIVAVLQEALPHWRFQPVMRDGKPAVVHTFISTRVLAAPTKDGKFRVRVDYIGAGPMDAPGSSHPTYPAAAIRARESGLILVSYDLRPDGSHVGVEVRGIDGGPNGPLVKPVREWVQRTTSTPETVNGEPVSAHVATYVRFDLVIVGSASVASSPNDREKKQLMLLGFTYDGELEKTPISESVLKPALTEPVVLAP
jgi:hypothetical protein